MYSQNHRYRRPSLTEVSHHQNLPLESLIAGDQRQPPDTPILINQYIQKLPKSNNRNSIDLRLKVSVKPNNVYIYHFKKLTSF